MRRQPACSVACEKQSHAPAQHAFIGGHPLDTDIGRDRQHFLGNTSFGRPDSLGADAKRLLVQIQAAHELVAGIFGMTKPALRQSQSRRGNCSRVGVAHQRQNRMVERRGRNLDRTLLGRRRVRRQHSAHQFPFARNHKLLIVERVRMSLRNQRGDLFLFEEVFVEPSDLRQHLKIGEVLGLKIAFRPLGMVSMLAKALPQLTVAGITSNDILRICLKQILQRKPTLLECQFPGRLGGHGQERIPRRSRHVVLNLHHQRRYKIEVLMNVGELIEQLHHAVIIFERVQTHPWQTVFARNQIFVERLVLMPKKDDAQGWHCGNASLARGNRKTARSRPQAASPGERVRNDPESGTRIWESNQRSAPYLCESNASSVN